MNPITTQQVALDNALVAPEKRLNIVKCNSRIKFSKPQREATYQVTLDVLKLSPCYPAFLITAEVPDIYMHQLWNTIKKIKNTDAYQFKLDKKKCQIDTEVFLEILQICLILPEQEFVEPLSDEEMVSFIRVLDYSGMCNMLSAIHTDQMHQPWRTFSAIINRCISGKTIGRLYVSRYKINLHMIRDDSFLEKLLLRKQGKFKKIASPSKKLSLILEEEPAKKSKQDKKLAKKSTTVPIAGVVIRDTPGVSMSMKKVPTKVDRGKGMDLLSDIALLEAAQLKNGLKKSKQDTHMLYASGSGDGVGSQPKVPDEQQEETTGTNEGTSTIPRVPNILKYQSESENESWGDSDDDSNDDDSDDVNNDDDDDVDNDADGDNEASDTERTDSDDDENPNLNQNNDEEEEYEEEYVRTPKNYEFSDDEEEYEELYKDVNVRLKDAEHEEDGKGDAEMTDTSRDDVSQEKSYEQVEDDAHVTLTAAPVT
ncbi:hypothetical protein Tco_1376842 [Tanacetum coccineum]